MLKFCILENQFFEILIKDGHVNEIFKLPTVILCQLLTLKIFHHLGKDVTPLHMNLLNHCQNLLTWYQVIKNKYKLVEKVNTTQVLFLHGMKDLSMSFFILFWETLLFSMTSQKEHLVS